MHDFNIGFFKIVVNLVFPLFAACDSAIAPSLDNTLMLKQCIEFVAQNFIFVGKGLRVFETRSRQNRFELSLAGSFNP